MGMPGLRATSRLDGKLPSFRKLIPAPPVFVLSAMVCSIDPVPFGLINVATMPCRVTAIAITRVAKRQSTRETRSSAGFEHEQTERIATAPVDTIFVHIVAGPISILV